MRMFIVLLSFLATTTASAAETATAYFAGGCFWCMEADFEKLAGVGSAVSGYMGGSKPDPSYNEVSAGGTGHAEAVAVHYDPVKVSYAQLLDYFWRHIDPLTADAQFCDKGNQYRSAIFAGTPDEQQQAEASKVAVSKQLGQPVVTQIVQAGKFFPAEDYHQDYYKKHSVKYNFYRHRCGRDQRLKQIWGIPKKS